MDIEIRPLAVSDIPAVCETQAGAYKDSSFYEPPETFAAYLRAFPAGSFAAVANDSLVGYGVGTLGSKVCPCRSTSLSSHCRQRPPAFMFTTSR